jgi:hypothetical protein
MRESRQKIAAIFYTKDSIFLGKKPIFAAAFE